jgi:ABC-type multidrug transport system fused ATPase/permease subunit
MDAAVAGARTPSPRRSAIVFGLGRLRRHPWTTALLAVVLIGGTALQLVPALLLREYLDRVGLGGGSAAGSAVAAALWFVVVSLAVQILGVLEGYLAGWLAWTVTNELRLDVTAHVMDLDMAFHTEHLPGELVERIDGDIGQLSIFMSRFLIFVVSQGLLLVALATGLAIVDWRIGPTLVPVSVLAFLVIRRFSTNGRRTWLALSRARAALTGNLTERLDAVPDLIGNGAGQLVNATVRVKADDVARADVRADIFGSIVLWAVTSFLAWLATATALWWSWQLYTTGAITVGTAFLVFTYTQQMITPLDMLTFQNQDYQAAAVAVSRVQELLAIPARQRPAPAQPFPPGAVDLEFRDVDFGYHPEQVVLHRISFRVPAGRTLGVVGRTGSGKSTIARLITRLYEPTSGAVLIGGTRSVTIDEDDLRRGIGVVPQEVQIFAATVRDNLTIFAPRDRDSELEDVLAAVGLRDWLARLPRGLDTRIGGGYALSTVRSNCCRSRGCCCGIRSWWSWTRRRRGSTRSPSMPCRTPPPGSWPAGPVW